MPPLPAQRQGRTGQPWPPSHPYCHGKEPCPVEGGEVGKEEERRRGRMGGRGRRGGEEGWEEEGRGGERRGERGRKRGREEKINLLSTTPPTNHTHLKGP